jgi:hypothetical protein
MHAAAALPDPIHEALDTLEMPPEEIRIVTTSEDPELVLRYLELHRERLEESFDRRRRELAGLASELIDGAACRRGELRSR